MTTHEHRTPPTSPAEPTDEPVRARRRRGRRGGPGLVTRVAGDALSVRRAFGEPVVRGDVTLVPVAKVMGASGSGYGTGEVGGEDAEAARGVTSSGSGGGGGFAVRVKPLGVYVVQGSTVQWRPALDLNRIILGGQIVGAVSVLAITHALRRRRRR